MLVTPNPLVEETVDSFICRFARINFLKSGTQAQALLLPRFPDARIISCAMQLTVDEIVSRHTVLPFTECLMPGHRRPSTANAKLGHFRSRLSKGTFKSHSAYCRSCSTEDTAWFGYSYWRRFHQLPKVMFCAKHREKLVHLDVKQFEVLPHELIERETQPTNSLKATTESLEWAYAKFACQILDQKPELHRSAVRRMLLAEAEQLGVTSQTIEYGPGRHGVFPRITQLLRDNWQCMQDELTLPRQHSSDANMIPPLDLALNSPNALFANLALIAIGLFKSPTHALKKLMESNELKRSCRPEISEWELLNSYRECRGNTARMARSQGVSWFSLRESLNKRGLSSFPANTDTAVQGNS